MLTPNTTSTTTTRRRPCACRGAGQCDTCQGHVCAGQCICEVDGAPQHQLHGYVNPTPTRLQAWEAKQEARR